MATGKASSAGSTTMVRPALFFGGLGAAAGFTIAALLWRNRRPPVGAGLATGVLPATPIASPPKLPPPQPAPTPTVQPGAPEPGSSDGFAPGYLGPSKADVEKIQDPNERNYTRGYATAVFALRGGIVIDVPYGSAEKSYVDQYTRGYEDADASKPPRYSNAATQISFRVGRVPSRA